MCSHNNNLNQINWKILVLYFKKNSFSLSENKTLHCALREKKSNISNDMSCYYQHEIIQNPLTKSIKPITQNLPLKSLYLVTGWIRQNYKITIADILEIIIYTICFSFQSTTINMYNNLFTTLPPNKYWIDMELEMYRTVQENKAMKILQDMELIFKINNITTNKHQKIIPAFLKGGFVHYAYKMILHQVFPQQPEYSLQFLEWNIPYNLQYFNSFSEQLLLILIILYDGSNNNKSNCLTTNIPDDVAREVIYVLTAILNDTRGQYTDRKRIIYSFLCRFVCCDKTRTVRHFPELSSAIYQDIMYIIDNKKYQSKQIIMIITFIEFIIKYASMHASTAHRYMLSTYGKPLFIILSKRELWLNNYLYNTELFSHINTILFGSCLSFNIIKPIISLKNEEILSSYIKRIKNDPNKEIRIKCVKSLYNVFSSYHLNHQRGRTRQIITDILNAGFIDIIDSFQQFTDRNSSWDIWHMIMSILSSSTRIGLSNKLILSSNSFKNYLFYIILNSGPIDRVYYLNDFLNLIQHNLSQTNVNDLPYFFPLLYKLINYRQCELIFSIINTCKMCQDDGIIFHKCITQCRKSLIHLLIKPSNKLIIQSKFQQLGNIIKLNSPHQRISFFTMSEIIPK